MIEVLFVMDTYVYVLSFLGFAIGLIPLLRLMYLQRKIRSLGTCVFPSRKISISFNLVFPLFSIPAASLFFLLTKEPLAWVGFFFFALLVIILRPVFFSRQVGVYKNGIVTYYCYLYFSEIRAIKWVTDYQGVLYLKWYHSHGQMS